MLCARGLRSLRSGRSQRPSGLGACLYSGGPSLASDRRLAGHALGRLAAGAAGALGGPLALHRAAAWRSLLLCNSCHGGSLFLFSLMIVSAQQRINNTYTEQNVSHSLSAN